MADEHRGDKRTGSLLLALGAVVAVGALIFGLTRGGDDGAPHDSESPSPTASGGATASASPSESANPADFVTASGQDLMLDGAPFRYAGANAYTLMFEAPSSLAVYMKTAKEANFTVMRTWAFYDTGEENGDLSVEGNTRGIYFQYWDAATGKPAFNDGETGLEHLDQVIAAAQEDGIKLVMPLVNNWTAFGGIDQYVRWADGKNHDDFFTDPQIKQWYRDWVSHLLNRVNTVTGVAYKDDPTIMAWELGNELQCSNSGPYPSSPDCGSDMMVGWADEMSQYVRSVDANHLIAWGGEGFLCTDPGGGDWLTNCATSADPVALLALDDIDLHGIHVYPYHWHPTEPTSDWNDWGAWWIDTQGAIAADANKPYYIGEYGWVDLSTRMLVYDNWLQHFYDAGGDGSHFWVMQPAVSIAQPPDSIGFTQKCPGPSCDLVSNWALHVGQDVPFTDFGPIAENDFAFENAKGIAKLDVLANDKVYDPATFDIESIDLDPETAGVQSTFTNDHGTFVVKKGTVTFTAKGKPSTTRTTYTVSDSEGRASTPRQIAVSKGLTLIHRRHSRRARRGDAWRMRICVAGLEVDAEPGVPVRALVEFARERGVAVPERPWCGPTRLLPDHPVGLSPLVAFARVGPARGPDARPRLGVHLAVVGGPDAGAVATLAEGLTIGRDEASGLRLTDATVSQAHASVRRGRIRDLGSRNGTSVGGRRVFVRARLKAGDAVRLGDSVVRLHDPSATEGENPPRASARTLATGGAASLTMVAFAVASGHWLLGLAALAVPLLGGAAALARSRPPAPSPAFDVTGTLGLDPLADGPVAVRGSRGLVRAVTLATGRPAPSARQWEAWMGLLPPADREVAWVQRGEATPSWAQVLVREDEGKVAVSAHGVTSLSPLPLVSAANAEATARRIASLAEAASLPRRVTWGQLPAPAGELPVRLGIGVGGPVVLDLVADGPHLLVAGTTGSGKSEALRTMVASLAYDRSPERLTFALIDFKGGAGLGPCADLPHVASVLTDLEPHLARRCLLALGAELAARKRAIAEAGATAFEEWRGERPPRLVVVVDEFQEIATADREFLPHLARLAAQGRSLGMHLVLATQRPAGAVGAEIRANIGTTLALRTASEGESHDLIGAADAARIPADVPGRAVLLRSGGIEPVQVAVAVADPPPAIRAWGEPAPQGRSLVVAARERHAGRAAPLWLPPLPPSIAPTARRGGGLILGVADRPSERLREPLSWDPGSGPLVVAGPPRSGKSTALVAVAALARQGGLVPVWVPGDARLAARTLALAAGVPGALLVIDDAARTLAAAATAEPEAWELLATAMHRLPVALAVPPGWANHRLTTSAGLRLVLTGLGDADDAAWDVPRELRGIPSARGRVRAQDASGWREAQLALPGRWAPLPLVRPLPDVAPPGLPPAALGIGGDEAVPLLLGPTEAAVLGPPGDERDAVAARVRLATGVDPRVAESAFALGGPAAPTPATIVIVRPTARSVREVVREGVHGLLEPSPAPLRAVVVTDGVARAVQVLPG